MTLFALVARRWLERALDVRFEKAMEENRALVREGMRRTAKIYDTQYEPMRTTLSIVYRLRNAMREAAQPAARTDIGHVREAMRRVHSYHDALEELLFEEKAILPAALFETSHEVKQATQIFMVEVEEYVTSMSGGKDGAAREKRLAVEKRIDDTYERIDALYAKLADGVHAALGVD